MEGDANVCVRDGTSAARRGALRTPARGKRSTLRLMLDIDPPFDRLEIFRDAATGATGIVASLKAVA